MITMDFQFWLEFSFSIIFGLVLILFAHGKMPGTKQLSLKLSRAFLMTIKYIGWFSLIYSCYGLWLDLVLRN